jgi:hypothetical protein
MEDFYGWRPVPIDFNMIAKLIGLPIDGVNPEKYLNEKPKENFIVEEVKVKFGTDRGRMGMIIKNINDPATRFATNLMAYNLLRKFCKEEAPAGVVAVVAQCTKGTILSWT